MQEKIKKDKKNRRSSLRAGVDYSPARAGVDYSPARAEVDYSPARAGVDYSPARAGVDYSPARAGVDYKIVIMIFNQKREQDFEPLFRQLVRLPASAAPSRGGARHRGMV